MTTAPRRTKDRAKAVDGQARVHVHKDVHSVGLGDFVVEHSQGEDGADERTWSFATDPQTADAIIQRYEFAAASSGSVPLTHDEHRIAEDMKARSNVEVGRMAAALAHLAEERVLKDA